jgi:tetratricopeptide (TPR) repeat protein
MKRDRLSFKRINFLLDSGTIQHLNQRSYEQQIHKSILIRDWVNNTSKITFISKFKWGGKNRKFQLLLDSKTYTSAVRNSSKMKLTLSQYFRIVIENNLSKSKSAQHKDEISVVKFKALWEKGRFSELNSLVISKEEKLSDLQNYYLAKANVELCKFDRAVSFLNVNKEKYLKENDMVNYFEMRLIEADIQIHLRNTVRAKEIIQETLNAAKSLNNKNLIGKSYYLLADVSIVGEDYQGVVENVDKALVYLDLSNYPTERVELYMYLARVKLWELDLISTKKLLDKSMDIIKTTNNIYHLGWYYGTLGCYQIIKNLKTEALDSLNKSVMYHRESGSEVKDTHYNYDVLTRLKLSQDQNCIDNICGFFNKSLSLENSFRPNAKLSTVKLYRSFSQAKYNYNSAIKDIETMINQSNGTIKPETAKYILNSTKYLNSETEIEKEEGRRGLVKLSIEGNFKLIRERATKTLQTNHIQMIVR